MSPNQLQFQFFEPISRLAGVEADAGAFSEDELSKMTPMCRGGLELLKLYASSSKCTNT